MTRRAEEGFTDFWADKSTGTKIAALAGAVFGGALEGFTKGRVKNTFMDHLDKAVDRDLRRQQEERRELGRAVKGQSSLMQTAYAVSESDKEALLRGKLMANELAQRELAKLDSLATTEDQKRRLAEANAAIEENQAKLRLDLAPTVVTNVRSKRVPVGGGGSELGPGAKFAGPEGQRLWNTLRDTDKQKARDAASAYRDVIATTQQMEQLRGEYKTELFASEAAEKYKQLQLQLVGSMTTLMNSGVLNEGEFERYSKSTGGDLSPKFSDAQRIFTLGGIDPTLNAVRGFRRTVQEKASRVGRDRWGIDIQTGASGANFATARQGAPR